MVQALDLDFYHLGTLYKLVSKCPRNEGLWSVYVTMGTAGTSVTLASMALKQESVSSQICINVSMRLCIKCLLFLSDVNQIWNCQQI